ncbi:hypothetical protein H9Q13_12730 [Pontibacter sp. JH31]|uniref:Uncharacterized protein n=1 Tax=Pontibacter aquaedesilientis TaxID=2766980 RepID=A0ABR7XIB2_9BACT|nr:hypothetical protein [Pontibacter aquaedesilientis]MBD1398035.1 hypothetical protein [Pontibacter aquaedesilientis]
MLRGLFKFWILSKLFGGRSGAGGGKGRGGCGGIGCLGLIVLAVLAYFLFQYLGGDGGTTADF